MIRRMVGTDVETVARIHLESFPGFFLSFLGIHFLKLLYASTLEDEDGVAFVDVDEKGRPVAFVAGVMRQGGFYRRLLRRGKWRFALAAAGAVLRRPSITARLARALRRPKESLESSAEACLMSLARSPAVRGRGVGRALVAVFAEEARHRGAKSFCLTTDAVGNDGVNAFYLDLGFQLARVFETPEGRRMNEYVMRLG